MAEPPVPIGSSSRESGETTGTSADGSYYSSTSGDDDDEDDYGSTTDDHDDGSTTDDHDDEDDDDDENEVTAGESGDVEDDEEESVSSFSGEEDEEVTDSDASPLQASLKTGGGFTAAAAAAAADKKNQKNHLLPHSHSASEWDKALLQGKASTGKASDFFSVPQQHHHHHRRTQSSGNATKKAPPSLHQLAAPLSSSSSLVGGGDRAAVAAAAAKKPPLRPRIDVSSPPAVGTNTSTNNNTPGGRGGGGGGGGGARTPPPPPHSSASAPSFATALESPKQQQQQQGGRPPTSSSSSSSIGKGSVVVHVQSNNNDAISTTTSSSTRPPHTTTSSASSSVVTANTSASAPTVPRALPVDNSDLSAGVLPDVLMNMRQKIESFSMFDSEMIKLTGNQIGGGDDNDDEDDRETRESLKRSSQQSISAAVLVSLAHKRYERRRLAAMEIEKVVRSLVALHHQQQQQQQQQAPLATGGKLNNTNNNELERIYAILLLLSDDFCRSTNEDARKGGTVALAACAIGLKRAPDEVPTVLECRDLILASVVHACQDHSQRVRYYATESLFNVVKVIPSLAVQHFFILFEVLRSLFADVDPDVRSGAELLDKKLKEVIVGAMNAGVFTADACVPVFGRFVYMRNKATKRLTLTWLQELNEKLIGAPILEFLHLFLGGVIEMVADPSVAIRQSALAFLQSVLPKLLVVNSEAIDGIDDQGMKVDFDKILQALVTTLEHANPFVRKVAMYWVSRIVKAHMLVDDEDDGGTSVSPGMMAPDGSFSLIRRSSSRAAEDAAKKRLSAAAISVRNSVPHVLPGVLLSVGDNFVSTNSATAKDAFLPDQTTRSLAEQTNACLQDAVRRDGPAFVEHLDGFIVALREEMASPGGFGSKTSPAIERTPFRMDVVQDGTGIETAGWFRSSREKDEINPESVVMSRLCALHWVIVLYESVVPDPLKADYAREFVSAIIHQLADSPPETIVYKSLEVLARITVPVEGEDLSRKSSANVLSGLGSPLWTGSGGSTDWDDVQEFPMTDSSVAYAMKILETEQRRLKSRDRQVFSALIQLHAHNEQLLANLSNVLTYMCRLQPPEFVMVSFSVELDRFIKQKSGSSGGNKKGVPSSSDLRFLSAFIQHMSHVLLNADETKQLRKVLKDCISSKKDTEVDHQRSRLFHILLHSFSHNIVATLSLCLWAGAYRTASLFLNQIDPLDISLILLLEVDRLVELLERPLFRHLHVRMLERDQKPLEEGSGVMLFQLLKSLLMILPQSACYRVLRDRLVSVSRYRQSTITVPVRSQYADKQRKKLSEDTKSYVARIQHVRNIHCTATWENVRQESLEMPKRVRETNVVDEGADRREWLGYSSKEEALSAEKAHRDGKKQRGASFSIEDVTPGYHDFDSAGDGVPRIKPLLPNEDEPKAASDEGKEEEQEEWKQFWSSADDEN